MQVLVYWYPTAMSMLHAGTYSTGSSLVYMKHLVLNTDPWFPWSQVHAGTALAVSKPEIEW